MVWRGLIHSCTIHVILPLSLDIIFARSAYMVLPRHQQISICLGETSDFAQNKHIETSAPEWICLLSGTDCSAWAEDWVGITAPGGRSGQISRFSRFREGLVIYITR